MVFWISLARSGSPLRACAIASLTAAISGEGGDDVAATAGADSAGLGRGIAPVAAAFVADAFVADALSFAPEAFAVGALALSFAAAVGALAFSFAAAALSLVAVLADFSFWSGAPPAESACRAMPRTPTSASAVKIWGEGGTIKLSSSLPSGCCPTFIHLIILTKH